LVYCEEAPESWFADYGEGTLANGKASVTLDKDFAAVVDLGRYYVFPVAHDAGCKGLAVTARTPTDFTVQEMAGGASSGTFAYRVVARRKDVKVGRLAKADVPKAPTIDPASFPKAAQ
jgi:hypothetical protein